jgi:hypothetical protein
MEIKKLDRRSKLFHFGFTYKIENDIFDHNDMISRSLRDLVGNDNKKYVFFDSSESLKRMQTSRFTIDRLYDGDVAYHYDCHIKCEVYYIKHESTLALLKLIL